MYLGRIVEAGPTEDVLPRPAAPLHAGAAVGGARDRAARAGGAHRRGAGPDAGSRPAAGSTRAARRWPTARADAAGVEDACRRDPAGGRCRRRGATHAACHLVAARGGDRHEPEPGRTRRAAARRCTSTPTAWARERDRVLYGAWFCVGRVRRPRADRAAAGSRSSTWSASRWCVTRDDDGPARGVQRVPAPRLPAVPGRARRRPPVCAAAGALRCPYHSWTYSLAGSLLRAPHTDGVDSTRRSSRCTRWRVEAWEGFVFVHLDAGDARRWPRRVAKAAASLANYAMGELVTGLTLGYEVAANWKVVAENYNECYHCGPVHPELSRLVPAFARRRRRPDLGGRHPAPRGGLDLHDERHHHPGAAAGPGRGGADPAQG